MSEKAFVSLSDEIELTNTYLELEKIRFKDDFKYEMNTLIKIPTPMK